MEIENLIKVSQISQFKNTKKKKLNLNLPIKDTLNLKLAS